MGSIWICARVLHRSFSSVSVCHRGPSLSTPFRSGALCTHACWAAGVAGRILCCPHGFRNKEETVALPRKSCWESCSPSRLGPCRCRFTALCPVRMLPKTRRQLLSNLSERTTPRRRRQAARIARPPRRGRNLEAGAITHEFSRYVIQILLQASAANAAMSGHTVAHAGLSRTRTLSTSSSRRRRTALRIKHA